MSHRSEAEQVPHNEPVPHAEDSTTERERDLEFMYEALDRQGFSKGQGRMQQSPDDYQEASPLLSPQQQRQYVREVRERLQLIERGLGRDERPNAEWLAEVTEMLLPLPQFRAGSTRQHIHAWEEWLDLREAEDARVHEVIKHGIQMDFVNPQAEDQQKRPGHRQRYRQIQRQMQKLFGKQAAEEMLAGTKPGDAAFLNRESVDQHPEFVREEVQSLLKVGAWRTWQSLGMTQPPTLLHGLGVAVNRKGKLRLVVDARYLNLFIRYAAFSYETLHSAIALLQPGDWMFTTDFKSGYHQIPMHESTWQYLGTEVDGQIYVMPYLPFGVSSACREYTAVMQCVYKPLRAVGMRLASYIDDALGRGSTEAEAKYLVTTLCRLLTALGFFLSINKCMLQPRQQALFLGMLLDTVLERCTVPEEKIQYFKQQVEALLRGKEASNQQMASAAGLLLSFKPAMHIAPMFARGLYAAIQRTAAKDQQRALPTVAEADLRWWAEMADAANGKSWRERAIKLRFSSDASVTAYAAYSLDDAAWRMIVGFTAEEVIAAKQGTFSSSLREVRTIRLALQSLAQRNAQQLQGARIQWFSDSQVAVTVLRNMKGNATILPEVRMIYQLAFQLDLHFNWQWLPRTDSIMQAADDMSKLEDPSAFIITAATARRIHNMQFSHPITQQRVTIGRPTLDVFGGSAADEQQAQLYYTEFYNPAAAGTDAFMHDWTATTARYQLAFVFPPADLVLSTLRRLQAVPCHAVLLLPPARPTWKMLLDQLPVLHVQRMKWHPGLYRPGARAPQSWAVSMPKLHLDVYRLWPQVRCVAAFVWVDVCPCRGSSPARFCLC